jgi:hypothetical protein
MLLIRKTKIVVVATNPTARMMHAYSGALSDILQPTDQLPHALNSSHFPQAGTRFFKQIKNKIFAAPQKLSRWTVRGRICDRRAEGCLRGSLSGRRHSLDRRAPGPIPECRPRACQFRFAGFADKLSIPQICARTATFSSPGVGHNQTDPLPRFDFAV